MHPDKAEYSEGEDETANRESVMSNGPAEPQPAQESEETQPANAEQEHHYKTEHSTEIGVVKTEPQDIQDDAEGEKKEQEDDEHQRLVEKDFQNEEEPKFIEISQNVSDPSSEIPETLVLNAGEYQAE